MMQVPTPSTRHHGPHHEKCDHNQGRHGNSPSHWTRSREVPWRLRVSVLRPSVCRANHSISTRSGNHLDPCRTQEQADCRSARSTRAHGPGIRDGRPWCSAVGRGPTRLASLCCKRADRTKREAEQSSEDRRRNPQLEDREPRRRRIGGESNDEPYQASKESRRRGSIQAPSKRNTVQLGGGWTVGVAGLVG